MVGESPRVELEDVLNEKLVHHILLKAIGRDVTWNVMSTEIKPAVDGIAGFLGDHMKAILHVEVQGELKKVPLFVKTIPAGNQPKAEYIDQKNYFRREVLMYNVLDEISDTGPNPWCVKAYICTESIIVMPDLACEGYTAQNFLETLDPEHLFLTTASLARFHAAFVNYETQKSIALKRPYIITQDFSQILEEPQFYDSPWLRASSKLSANFLNTFSTKAYRGMPHLEEKLTALFLEACHSLREYNETLNVLLHKDLWVNNILFKYENNVPTSAVLIDYQCLRYGPPAFDLMIFMYLTTDRRFREQREQDVFEQYYSIFAKGLNDDSKKRVDTLCYSKENFLKWCENVRMFSIFVATAFHPFILMDPKSAQKAFDDPETFEKHIKEDRTEPVLAHAHKCHVYRDRILEANEEFVERYVLKKLP